MGTLNEISCCLLLGSAHTSSGKNSVAPTEPTATSIRHSMPLGSTPMQLSLFDMKRNVTDLRLQLHQMRQLQVFGPLCVGRKTSDHCGIVFL